MTSATVSSNARAHRCLVCAGTRVEMFLDLGETALANRFLGPHELNEPEPRYPLRVGSCHDCGHIQLIETVPPNEMFDDYLYVSSASDTLRAHFEELSAILVGRLALRSEDLVIDIGCNDGSLLGAFRGHGVRTLGVDPARNLAELANDLGIERYVGYFGARSAGEICDRWGCAALITTTNTFPHIPDLQDFLSGVLTVLAPGGTFVIESHYLGDLLEQLAFDTIYHEHVSYWALAPMIRLLEDVGMEVVSVEHLPIHHGQLRVSVMRRGEGSVDGSVAERLALEESLGLARFDTFTDFSQRVQRIRGDLHATMDDLKAQGARLAGYGAPAKGSTLLEYLEIGPRTVEYIVDRSPLKQGRFTPGSHIPIVSPERLLTDGPDYVLLMAWNFAEEILEQQAEYRRRGGRFILPIPAVQIL